MKQELIILAETASTEDERVEFKREFRPDKKAAFWTETVKDIVALANTNGGILLFGLTSNGESSGIDCSNMFAFDPADITNQVAKYTGFQFSDFSIEEAVRKDGRYPALIVLPARIPMIFTRVGCYEVSPGQQKTAFSQGTLYFRHGAKSETANQDDIRDAIYRELCRVREEWLGNIRKVTEATPGIPLVITEDISALTSVRITNDTDAPLVRVKDLSDTHPYRQKEVIEEVVRRHNRKIHFSSHDMQAIKLAENLSHSTHPDLIHRPHPKGNPQYSGAFIEFICEKIAANDNYLADCRSAWKAARYA